MKQRLRHRIKRNSEGGAGASAPVLLSPFTGVAFIRYLGVDLRLMGDYSGNNDDGPTIPAEQAFAQYAGDHHG